MKNFIFSVAILCATIGPASSQVIFSEYFEDCSLPIGWTVETTQGDTAWTFGDNAIGTPGGSVDGSCMAYFHDDDYGDFTPAVITDLNSPVWDISSNDTAELHFDYMFQTLGAVFHVALWNGTAWDTVWTLDSNPPCTGQFFPGCSAEQATINITDYLSADFQAKFIYDDQGIWDWYIAIDNVEIYVPPTDDITAQELVTPVDGCGMSATETVSLSVYNNGINEITTFDASYSVNGMPAVTQTFNTTLQSSGTDTVSFSIPADLSTVGTYSIQVWVDLPTDLDPANDTLLVEVESIPVISTMPYAEDFESGAGGWTAGGESVSWELGEPMGALIDTAFSGVNAWVTNLTGVYNINELSYVESPCFDFSGIPIDPILEFAIIYNTEQCCDEGYVDVSVDAGVTWTRLGAAGEGTNWYNDAFNNEWDGNSGDSTTWLVASHLLDGTAGQGSVKIRIGFSSDISIAFEGFGFDNVSIYEQPAVNIGVAELIAPNTGCGLGSEDVVVAVQNFGSEDISGYNLVYNAGGGDVSMVVSDTLYLGETDTLTFGGTLDLSTAGTYTITAWTEIFGDGDNSNDTLTYELNSIPAISGLPYVEDFESGPGGWYATMEGATGIWEFGDPEGVGIDTANSGVNAWATNLDSLNYPNGMLSYLYSPCFDLSSLIIDPILNFAIIHNSEINWDGTWVEVSTDAGVTWSLLGNLGEGENWYTNGGFFNGNITQGWDGISGEADPAWIIAEHLLDGTAGYSDVIIRFGFSSDDFDNLFEGAAIDDISLTEQPPINTEIVSVVSPVSSCGLGVEDLIVEIANLGSTDVDSVIFSYQLNGGAVVEEITYLAIPATDTAEVPFFTSIDLSIPGDYDLTVIVSTVDDGDMSNDTLHTVIQSIPTISSLPYFEDFENGSGGWSSTGGTEGNWELGDPEGTEIDTAFSGVNAWSTNLNTLFYNNGQLSFLTSPCIDLSAETDDPLFSCATIFDSEFNYDAAWMEVTVDGGLTWTLVGNVGDGTNWYTNDNFFNFAITEGWAGQSAGSIDWQESGIVLEGTAGFSDVRIRFVFASDGSVNGFEGVAIDDVLIRPQPQYDLEAISLDEPNSNCDLDQEPVTLTYTNIGLLTLYSYELGYSVDGNVHTETVTDSIAHGQTLTYTFNQTADLSTPGDFEVVGFTSLANDEWLANDTLAGLTITHHANTPTAQTNTDSLAFVGGDGGVTSSIFFCGLPSELTNCWGIDRVTIDGITHDWVSDLEVSLIPPAGDTILLFSDAGCCTGGAVTDVNFQYGAENEIQAQQDGISPGVYGPVGVEAWEALHNGENPNGEWQLYVNDPLFGDQGALTGWTMTFGDRSPVPDLSYGDSTICINHVIDLSATAGLDSYLWNTGQNGQTIQVDGEALGAGTHEFSVAVDFGGCTGYSDTITITVDECVGIEEADDMIARIFPNPSEGQLTIELSEGAEATMIEIVDASGRTVLTESIAEGTLRKTFDLTALAEGVYGVRLNSERQSRTSRFVIQR